MLRATTVPASRRERGGVPRGHGEGLLVPRRSHRRAAQPCRPAGPATRRRPLRSRERCASSASSQYPGRARAPPRARPRSDPWRLTAEPRPAGARETGSLAPRLESGAEHPPKPLHPPLLITLDPPIPLHLSCRKWPKGRLDFLLWGWLSSHTSTTRRLSLTGQPASALVGMSDRPVGVGTGTLTRGAADQPGRRSQPLRSPLEVGNDPSIRGSVAHGFVRLSRGA
jgi:hypothetical protein